MQIWYESHEVSSLLGAVQKQQMAFEILDCLPSLAVHPCSPKERKPTDDFWRTVTVDEKCTNYYTIEAYSRLKRQTLKYREDTPWHSHGAIKHAYFGTKFGFEAEGRPPKVALAVKTRQTTEFPGQKKRVDGGINIANTIILTMISGEKDIFTGTVACDMVKVKNVEFIHVSNKTCLFTIFCAAPDNYKSITKY